MNAKIKHKNPKFWDGFINRHKGMPQIALGFPRGQATAASYPDGTSVVDVAFWNNYGTKNQEGGVAIPARRFMDIGGRRASQETLPYLKKMVPKINEGKIKEEDVAEVIGNKAVAILKKEITELSEPPNAPATIAKKKSSNPLIDTGLMRQTVTFELRGTRK